MSANKELDLVPRRRDRGAEKTLVLLALFKGGSCKFDFMCDCKTNLYKTNIYIYIYIKEAFINTA